MSNKDDLLYGIHAVRALLKFAPERLKTLYIQEGKTEPLVAAFNKQAQKLGVPIRSLPKASLDKQTNSYTHQGVAALAKATPLYAENQITDLLQKASTTPLVLVLDSIQDPQNFGACLRTADACGVDFVIIAKNQRVGLTPVVHKVSCGASQALPIVQATNLTRALSILKDQGLWIVGTALDTNTTIYDMDLKGPTALVLGGEGQGMRQGIAKQCDYLAKIPMHGHVQSLNVSAANAVCLFECVRQRHS